MDPRDQISRLVGDFSTYLRGDRSQKANQVCGYVPNQLPKDTRVERIVSASVMIPGGERLEVSLNRVPSRNIVALGVRNVRTATTSYYHVLEPGVNIIRNIEELKKTFQEWIDCRNKMSLDGNGASISALDKAIKDDNSTISSETVNKQKEGLSLT